MSVEQAIHERWAADEDLNNLVPVERLVTGTLQAQLELPCVVLTPQRSGPKTRTSSGMVEEALLRLTVWAADLDQARDIAAEIARVFDRTSFTTGGLKVLNMQRVHTVDKVQRDSTWRSLLDYQVIYEV